MAREQRNVHRKCARAAVKPACLALQIVLCILLVALLLGIGCSVFSSWALNHPFLSATVVKDNPAYTGFLVFWSYVILLSPAMPITLYITLVHNTMLL